VAQLEGKSGAGDHAAVIGVLQAAMNSAQSQVRDVCYNYLLFKMIFHFV
jgi:hypothetical protein